MIRALNLVFFVSVFISCSSSNVNSSKQGSADAYKKIAIKNLGSSEVKFLMNEDDSFVLCTEEKEGTAKQPRNLIKYIVIRLSNNSISYEGTVNGGTVSWYNQKMIQVYRTPGIMRKDQTRDDFITLYDVETGKSYPKNQKETH